MQTLARAHIGVDLHRDVVQVSVLDERGHERKQRRFRLREAGGTEAVLAYLEGWGAGSRIAVEAMGLNRWLVNGCQARGLEVLVVDPVKLGLKTTGTKTDRRDAYELARRLWLGDLDRNARTYYPTDEEYAVRKLVRTRHKLVGMRQEVVNQIRAILNAYRLGTPAGHLYSGVNLSWLEQQVSELGRLGISLRALTMTLPEVQQAIRLLGVEVREVARHDRGVQGLMEIDQIAALTAVTLIYELGPADRFTRARAVASYAGLSPRVSNSGERTRHGRLTRRGNSLLRWILGQMAVRLLAYDPAVKRWAAPRLRRMHINKLRVVLARRLLISLVHCLRSGEVFSREKCLGIA